MPGDLISVGEIINTWGIRGEVKVWPLTDFPERFKPGAAFRMEKDDRFRTLTVETARFHKNVLLIKFLEIADTNAAGEIKGGILKITRDQLSDLPPDSFYIFEIIGMEVLTTGGVLLGRVKDILTAGGNDIYVVAGEFKDYLIPAVKQVVRKVDSENRRMVIEPMDGLLDL